MTKLDLEFIHRTRVPWIGLAFFLMTASLAAFQVAEWIELRAIYQRSQERTAKLELAVRERQRNAIQSQNSASPASAQRLKDYNKISHSLNYPWNRVLSTIEQTDGNDVAILSFAHDQSAGETQLAVEALDVPALIRFVEKMNDGNEGSRWYLANYQLQPQNNPPTVKGSILNR